MQDDHFSYKNCYQHGSCVKKKKRKLDLKKLYKKLRNYLYERDKKTKTRIHTQLLKISAPL